MLKLLITQLEYRKNYFLGETIKIVVEDYVQHISGYNFKLLYDPELLHGTALSYHNKIHVEFQLLYRWHALMPDHLVNNNTSLSIQETLFNPKPFVEAGMKNWVEDATRQYANKVRYAFTWHYDGKSNNLQKLVKHSFQKKI